jgi:hypothetical protein
MEVAMAREKHTLALGCTVPHAYRAILRKERVLERFTLAQLEEQLLVPAEYVGQLLEPSFEDDFEAKLVQCDAD